VRGRASRWQAGRFLDALQRGKRQVELLGRGLRQIDDQDSSPLQFALAPAAAPEPFEADLIAQRAGGLKRGL